MSNGKSVKTPQEESYFDRKNREALLKMLEKKRRAENTDKVVGSEQKKAANT